jgi:hypothetical protein
MTKQCDDIEHRLQIAYAAARSVWKFLPGPVARPNYGWWCKRHDSVHTGRDYRAVNGELVCPEAENRDLTNLVADGGCSGSTGTDTSSEP